MILEEQLAHLESTRLIRALPSEQGGEYIFQHVLIQETTYDRLLHQERKRIHKAVGEIIETQFADHLGEVAAVLGEHFAQAEEASKAMSYFSLAADRAASLYANQEAIAHYRRSLSIAEDLSAPSDQVIQWYSGLIRVLQLEGRYPEAMAAAEALQSLGQGRNDKRMQLAALLEMGTVLSTPTSIFNFEAGEAVLQRGLALAGDLEDRAAEAKILWNLLLLNVFGGRTNESLNYGKRSVILAREVALEEQLAFTLHDLSRSYLILGDFRRSLDSLSESREIWRRRKNLPMLADNLTSSAETRLFTGEFDLGMEELRESLRISQSITNAWGQGYANFVVGCIQFEWGEFGAALECLELSMRQSITAGFAPAAVFGRGVMAWVYILLGDPVRAKAQAQDALANAKGFLSNWRAWPLATLALAALHAGKDAEAELLLREAQEAPGHDHLFTPAPFLIPFAEGILAFHRQDYSRMERAADEMFAKMKPGGALLCFADAALLKAIALHARGATRQAVAQLEEGCAVARQTGSRRGLWPALHGSAVLEEELGNADAAARLWAECHQVLEYITGHLPAADSKERFLSQPAVQAAWEAQPALILW